MLNSSKNEAFDREFSDSNSSNANLYANGKKESIQSSECNEQPFAELVNNIIRKIKKLDGNNLCCDCGSVDSDWLVTNLGILICIECCGIHRELGVQISKTQSLKIDRLSTSQLIVKKKTFS